MDVCVRATAGGVLVGDFEVPLHSEELGRLMGIVEPNGTGAIVAAAASQVMVVINAVVGWVYMIWLFADGRYGMACFALAVMAATDASIAALTDHGQEYSLVQLYARPQRRMRAVSLLLPVVDVLNFMDLYGAPATCAHEWCSVLRLRHLGAMAFYRYLAGFPYIFLQALLPTSYRVAIAVLCLLGIVSTTALLLILKCCTRNVDVYWLDGFGLYPWSCASQALVLVGSYFVVAMFAAVSFYVSETA